jgi:hypothetical protein
VEVIDMNKTIRFFLSGIILVAASALPLTAQDFGFTIVNGTGRTITEITIKPSRKLYGTDKDDAIVYQSLAIHNQQEMFIALPKALRGFEEFDIDLKYGGKNARTKDAVALTRGSNRFVAYREGKSPTVPLAAAGVTGVAAGVGVVVVATSVAAPVAAVSFSAVATSIVGGTLVCPPLGIALGAAAGVGFGAYHAVNHFVPHTLVMARDNQGNADCAIHGETTEGTETTRKETDIPCPFRVFPWFVLRGTL